MMRAIISNHYMRPEESQSATSGATTMRHSYETWAHARGQDTVSTVSTTMGHIAPLTVDGPHNTNR